MTETERHCAGRVGGCPVLVFDLLVLLGRRLCLSGVEEGVEERDFVGEWNVGLTAHQCSITSPVPPLPCRRRQMRNEGKGRGGRGGNEKKWVAMGGYWKKGGGLEGAKQRANKKCRGE